MDVKCFAAIKLFIPIALIIILIIAGCEDNGVSPISNKSPFDFTWTIDTLHIEGNFQTIMTSIWGSSPKNIYVAGHAAGVKGIMWQYDGTKWIDIKLSANYGGPIIGAFDLSAVYGFSPNDIWAVGHYLLDNPTPPPTFIHTSLIIHFNGSRWEVITPPKGDLLSRLWGRAPDDIWAGGVKSTLFHYNGTMWTKDSIEISVPEGGDFQITGIRGTSETTFACGFTGISNVFNEIYYFCMRKNNRWAVVDSFVVTSNNLEYKWGGGLWMTKEGYLFSYGTGGMFRWNGNNWQKFWGDISPACVDGPGTDYIIAVGGFGKAYFYNGIVWNQIKAVENPNVLFSAVWTDGKEAFIIGFTNDSYPQKTVVYHGK